MNILYKCIFGSHLYGTATEKSDIDIRGVFMPSKRDILLGRIPKVQKGEGADEEYYSLHYFIKLSCDGQTVAFDMLYAMEGGQWLETTNTWQSIQNNKRKFLSKNIKAFVGYARSQSAKYSQKGSRLTSAKNVLSLMESCNDHSPLSVIWTDIKGDHIYPIDNTLTGIMQVKVCGKILQHTMKIGYAKKIIENYLSEYGKRAQKAAEVGGKDWKAISHALRVLYEVKELLEDQTITFPLKAADLLRDVKQGKLDMQTEVLPLLDALNAEVEDLHEKSNLPEKVNRKFWDDFIVDTIEEYYL